MTTRRTSASILAEVDGPPPTNASPQLSLFTPSGQVPEESYRENQLPCGRPSRTPPIPLRRDDLCARGSSRYRLGNRRYCARRPPCVDGRLVSTRRASRPTEIPTRALTAARPAPAIAVETLESIKPARIPQTSALRALTSRARRTRIAAPEISPASSAIGIMCPYLRFMDCRERTGHRARSIPTPSCRHSGGTSRPHDEADVPTRRPARARRVPVDGFR